MQMLLIANDASSVDILVGRLKGAGFVARHVSSASAALANEAAGSAVAVLIDLGADAQPAHAIIQPLRAAGMRQPLMVLSARDDWRERVACLDAGADDYAVKPIHSEEIAARLRAVIRRSSGNISNTLVFDTIVLDIKAQCAWQDGACLNLTRNEFRLLRMLVLNHERPQTRRDIATELRPESPSGGLNRVEVLIARLRRKLGRERIQTVRGIGYRIVGEPVRDSAQADLLAQIANSPCCRRDSSPLAERDE